LVRAGAALLALVLVAVGAAGCGEEEGVADGAAVAAYVEEPLCGKGAYAAVVQNESGDGVGVKFVCLPAARGPELSQGVGGGRQIDLATAGGNARRATEDSRTVAYIAVDDPGVGRFTHPILEGAGIGWITADSRREAMRSLSEAIFEADMNELRAGVRDALGQ
jgi:hypothetical protein